MFDHINTVENWRNKMGMGINVLYPKKIISDDRRDSAIPGLMLLGGLFHLGTMITVKLPGTAHVNM